MTSDFEHSEVALFQADLSREVRQLVRRPAVWVDAKSTVGQAASLMRQERISSVLVRTEPPGIVTDRDFRNRVLAEGFGPDTPVTRILSSPLRSVDAATPIYEAWSTLLDAGVHHLPITLDGEIIGLLTSTDLLKCSAQGPVAVLRRVERLSSREELPGYGTMVAEMVSMLLSGRVDASVIAGFVARLNDALLHLLLRWAVRDLGDPPAPFAWIVFGSEGRMEQTLLTDQDNALIYADEGAARRDWFQALADRVNADLEAAGFPRCPGGYMANRWNGPLSEWIRRFNGWLDEPRPQSLLDASTFFDFRRVAGELTLEPLEEVLALAARKPVFLRFLARAAMEFRPPPSLLLRLRGDSWMLDLKRQGLAPIVFLARCYGLEIGGLARNTLERLDAATRAGRMEEDTRALITESYRFLLGLRLRLQLRLLSEGKPTTSKVVFSELSVIERGRLKDSLHAINRWQETASIHFQSGF